MPVNMAKTGISVGVGVGDYLIEWWDMKSGRTQPFKRATDIARLGVAAAGYGLQVFMPRYHEIGEALALSSTPLLIRSVLKAAKVGSAGEVSDFTPRRVVQVQPSSGWVPAEVGKTPGGYRPIT